MENIVFVYNSNSVDGVTVSIGAFQALVPGSTPGRRRLTELFVYFQVMNNKKNALHSVYILYIVILHCNIDGVTFTIRSRFID